MLAGTILVIILVMLKVSIAEAKAKLSKCLASAARGETVVICSRNAPITELRGLPRLGKRRRPVGLAKGQLRVPPRFFEPLADDLVAAFRVEKS